MFKAQTLSIVIGTEECPFACPYCVSKMTTAAGVQKKKGNFRYDNFEKACRYAATCGVTTALITGKGEPTLYPNDILGVTEVLNAFFPFVELQTAGILFLINRKKWDSIMEQLFNKGLNTVIISVVSWRNKTNEEIYCQPGQQYPDLSETIAMLKQHGFTVRLSCVGCKGYVDGVPELIDMLEFCYDNCVDQLTWRPVTRPDRRNSRNKKVYDACMQLAVSKGNQEEIAEYFASDAATHLYTLAHGANVYAWNSMNGYQQNVCISNCLTHSTDPTNQRQLIYFPDGSLRYSWEYEAAILLGPAAIPEITKQNEPIPITIDSTPTE